MPTLQRTVYIGLGGAGIKSILNTKKRFIESYGEVPPMIRFIGIDTDYCAFEEQGGVNLAPAERCHLTVPYNVQSIYSAHREEFSWLRSPNDNGLRCLNAGAGQIRTNGRFAFVFNVQTIQHTILQVVQAVEAVVGTPGYLIGGGPVAVNVTFSLAGGTGCGIFLDVAYLIRKLFGNNVRVNGYAILPDVYQEIPYRRNIFANSYAALQELDFLMHMRPEDEPVTFNWISAQFNEEDFRRSPTPFDFVFLIDNVNQRGFKYDLNQIFGIVGLALFAAGGQIGIQNEALFDTLRYPPQNEDLRINDKRAWASSLGVSEIVFDGKEAADFFALKVTSRMIEEALRPAISYETAESVASWIDERGYAPQDLLELISNTDPTGFDIQDKKDPVPEMHDYLSRMVGEARIEIDHHGDQLLYGMRSYLSSYLRQDNRGLSFMLDFIVCLERSVGSFIDEMEHEMSEFMRKRPILDTASKRTAEELSSSARKSFFTKSKTERLAEECVDHTREVAINEIEILRRQGAVKFYKSLMQELEEQRINLGRQSELLRQLATQLKEREAVIVRADQRFSSSLDLSVETVRSMPISEIAPDFGDFLRSLGDDGWECIQSVEDLEQAFHAFAGGLPKYDELRNMTVLERIGTMTEDEFVHILRKALELAYPLFRPNERFMHLCHTNPWQVIGTEVPCHLTRFANGQGLDQRTLSILDGANYVVTELKDRIIIYFHERMFVPFMIDNIEYWGEHYDRCRYDPHFDANIHERMQREYRLFANWVLG